MRKFIGRVQTTDIPFMGDTIKIRKLSAAAIKRIGAVSKVKEGDESNALDILSIVVNEGVVFPEGEKPLSQEELSEGFSIGDLNDLSNEIMKFSGVDPDKAPKGSEGNAV